MSPSVKLISYTPFPMETMYALWHASRTNAPALSAEQIHIARKRSLAGMTIPDDFFIGPAQHPFYEYFEREISGIAALDFPLKETIKFTFSFDDVSITWREQAVRQRRATAWSQTSRTRNLANFVDEGRYEEPLAIQADDAVHQKFQEVILGIQEFYRLATERGHTREDARCLQPTCQTHRIAFSYDARTLEATMADRLCFIAQAELWTPIIKLMMAEVLRVAPELSVLFHPPCIIGGKFRYCPVEHENERRMDGRDPYGPCPLWAMHQHHKWEKVPLRANAETQARRILPLWPVRIEQQVALYMNGRIV